MGEKEKTTVPIPSVGADGEQSLSYVSNEIITAETEEINPIDESMPNCKIPLDLLILLLAVRHVRGSRMQIVNTLR